jgi:hypothetical protein
MTAVHAIKVADADDSRAPVSGDLLQMAKNAHR